MSGSDTVHGVVEKVVRDGRHGPYAVALSSDARRLNITFSLNPEHWREETHPEEGSFVVLSHLSKKRAGWRAARGRFLKPSDEQ